MTESDSQPAARNLEAATAIAAVILVAAVALVYGSTIDAPFIYDDDPAIVENTSIRTFWPLWGDSERPGPLHPPLDAPTSARPFVNFTFALNYRFGGLNPAGYRAVNILIHAASAILLMLVVRRTLRLDYFAGRFEQSAGPLSFAAALLWAFHPLQTETVAYVTQRTELLVALFYLATLYSSLRYWAASARAGRAGWCAAAILACLLGMASKEVMVTAPVVVLLFERTFIAGTFRRALRESGPLYFGLAWTWALLVALIASGPRSASAGFSSGVSAVDWWFTQSKILWVYLKLAVWPWPLSIHYEMPYLTSLGAAWPWLIATAVLSIGVLWAVARGNPVGFAGAWTLLILSPTLVIPIATEMAAERRMYLPLAALVVLAVVGGYLVVGRALSASARTSSTTPRAALVATLVAMLLVAGVAGVASARRLTVYQDETALWQDVLTHHPDDSMALYNLGVFATNQNELPAAIDFYERALRARPEYAQAHYNLGTTLTRLGQRAEAIEHFQQALRYRPDYPKAAQNLAILLAKDDEVDKSLALLEQVVRDNPNDSDSYTKLGVTLMQAGRTSDAIRQFVRALELRSDNADAHNNLTNALVIVRRPAEAVAHGREAVRLIPDSSTAHNNLGAALTLSSDNLAAAREFEAAIQLNPDFVQAYGNLMVTYAALNRPADAIAAAEKGLSSARAAGEPKMAEAIGNWLDQYRALHSGGANLEAPSPATK